MLEIAWPLQKAQCERVAIASDGSRSRLLEFAHLFGRFVVATCLLLVGTYLIYGFGAGYMWLLGVRTPLNFAVSPILVVGLVLVVWMLASRPL